MGFGDHASCMFNQRVSFCYLMILFHLLRLFYFVLSLSLSFTFLKNWHWVWLSDLSSWSGLKGENLSQDFFSSTKFKLETLLKGNQVSYTLVSPKKEVPYTLEPTISLFFLKCLPRKKFLSRQCKFYSDTILSFSLVYHFFFLKEMFIVWRSMVYQ